MYGVGKRVWAIIKKFKTQRRAFRWVACAAAAAAAAASSCAGLGSRLANELKTQRRVVALRV